MVLARTPATVGCNQSNQVSTRDVPEMHHGRNFGGAKGAPVTILSYGDRPRGSRGCYGSSGPDETCDCSRRSAEADSARDGPLARNDPAGTRGPRSGIILGHRSPGLGEGTLGTGPWPSETLECHPRSPRLLPARATRPPWPTPYGTSPHSPTACYAIPPPPPGPSAISPGGSPASRSGPGTPPRTTWPSGSNRCAGRSKPGNGRSGLPKRPAAITDDRPSRRPGPDRAGGFIRG